MNQEFAYNILDVLQTMWDAAKQMEQDYAAGNREAFHSLSMDLWDSLVTVQTVIRQEVSDNKRIRLADACTCAMESLKDIKLLAAKRPEKVEWKLAYELEPILETAAIQFYYWGIVKENPGKRGEFQEFLKNAEAFRLLRDKKDHIYQFDMVIQVMAYNHLDYTMQCVNSILENMPKDISVELQLFNHGSTDGTKAYFESIESAEIFNIAVNGAMPGAPDKSMSRGKYGLFVSNDIIIGKNAIENMYRCAEENADYGYIVPSTPAVSNLQTIPADYRDKDGFKRFAEKNNIYDPRRHEQRVRLCNPVCLIPSLLRTEIMLEMYEETYCCKLPAYSFPDDRISLWMRRHGHKNILVKDAYCHHFGSVTLREENDKQQDLSRLYWEGREEFQRQHGIDPWGTGFGWEPKLFEVWKIQAQDNISVLGLNCGIGGNSLKVKEILREQGSKGVRLYNGTQEERFLQDLTGVSDQAFLFSELKDITAKTGKREFYYIVIEDPIQGIEEKELVHRLQEAGIKFSELAYKKPDGQWVLRILSQSGR